MHLKRHVVCLSDDVRQKVTQGLDSVNFGALTLGVLNISVILLTRSKRHDSYVLVVFLQQF